MTDPRRICFTGFSGARKARLEELAARMGYSPASSVLKSLSRLVAGSTPGPSKLKKAAEYGVPVVAEDDFLNEARTAGWAISVDGRDVVPVANCTERENSVLPSCSLPRVSFVALDFETANPRRDSACAIGLARVEQGELIEDAYQLLRPPTREFSPFNTAVHGLTWADVEEAPTFAEWWPSLRRFLDGQSLIVAHNAPFDRSVLEACCRHYGIDCPPLRFGCSLKASRQAWTGWVSHKLSDVCRALNVALRHHHAGEDAKACAMVWLHALGAGVPEDGCCYDSRPDKAEYGITASQLEFIAMADTMLRRELTAEDVAELTRWFERHGEQLFAHPFVRITRLLCQIWDDGIVDAGELAELRGALQGVMPARGRCS